MFEFLRRFRRSTTDTEYTVADNNNDDLGDEDGRDDEDYATVKSDKIDSFSNPSMVDIAPRDMQQLLRGTKKRFHENIEYNRYMLSERLSESDVAFEQFFIGTRSRKKVIMVYIKDVANPGIVASVRDSIKKAKAETFVDISYLERNIENSNISPFPQLEINTRPDVAESALFQGRVVIFLDGSPEALLAPATFLTY